MPDGDFKDRHPALACTEAYECSNRALWHLQSAIHNLKSKLHGGIAQLVERQLCKLEVRGSNPLASSLRSRREKSKDCPGKVLTEADLRRGD